ncbi:hypothetical protein B0H15DRAFT_277891 [Mycena belliarum]|uniref:Uncharacterized protein n=1 Tax=Mycena belliarum TaxID=1033014 RepID=A0AAD6U3C4_9AGAR|nr:hypothetical protein B0H15DRAFT_277891 [Mycena belliae]
MVLPHYPDSVLKRSRRNLVSLPFLCIPASASAVPLPLPLPVSLAGIPGRLHLPWASRLEPTPIENKQPVRARFPSAVWLPSRLRSTDVKRTGWLLEKRTYDFVADGSLLPFPLSLESEMQRRRLRRSELSVNHPGL